MRLSQFMPDEWQKNTAASTNPGPLLPNYGRPNLPHAPPYHFNSSRISAAARRAVSIAPMGKLIAPTFGCPPPPYRSQIVARLCFSGSRTHGFEPTETLVRKLDDDTETV